MEIPSSRNDQTHRSIRLEGGSMRRPADRSAGTRSSEANTGESRLGASTQRQPLDLLFASGELLPSQLAVRSVWSPEKKLAAAVLEGALTEIRNYGAGPRRLRALKAALDWVRSDDTSWPYAFRPLCELFA